VTAASPAAASVASQCTGQDRVIIKRVENVHKRFSATHVRRLTLAAGTTWHQETTVAHATTLRASATYTAEVGGSAGWGFAQLEAKSSMSLAAEGSHTSTRSTTEYFGIPAKGYDRRFALFVGRFQVSGRWHYLSCSRAPGRGVEKYGPIKSWGGFDSGTVLCPRSRYSSGDYRYRIAVQAGC
jgi:hypothetical protein